MLTQKGRLFAWSEECENSFRILKDKFSSAPILTLPEEGGKYVVYTDASKNGLGCVLMQEGKGIAYGSR